VNESGLLTRLDWLKKFYGRLGVPATRRNLIVGIVWIGTEGGLAKFNPLNCVMPLGEHWTLYNQVPGVKNYESLDIGLDAAVQTIRGPDHDYEPILARLESGKTWPWRTLSAIYASDWGTVRLPYMLRSVKRSFDFYAKQPIGQ